MEKTMNDILTYIYTNEEIDKYLSVMVPHQYKEDMKHFLILEVYKISLEKLIKLLENDTIKYLTFSIIRNQMSKDCLNCFYRIYIKPTGDIQTLNVKIIDDDKQYIDDPRLDEIDDILRSLKPWKVENFNLYYKEDMNFREVGEHLGMNPKTSQSWIYEVKEIIKNKLKK